MKIGILTHHAVVNFGAFWQAYSLQKAIKREFPDSEVYIINFIHIKHLFINNVGWFLFYKNRENIKNWGNVFKLPFTLYRARKKYMSLTKLCFSASQINKMNFDAIVVGSDEVWNYNDSKSVLPLKFGQGLNCKKLISYAPSAGNSDPEKDIPQFVLDGLRKFTAISVRDQTTEKLVEKVTGKKPQIVLDPTFLVDWEIKEKAPVTQKEYILMYYCEHLPQHIKQQINEYAAKNGLAVYGAGESDKEYKECTVNMTPQEWVAMFKGAKFVFTGTFHGAVFSILNHVQFKVYLTNKGRIAKVGNLLNLFGITGRNIDDNFLFDLDKQKNEIDYTAVDEQIKRRREESINYLREALK